LLYERGGQFLDQEQYAAMKEEYDRLGISPLDHPTTTIMLRWVREWVARYPRIWQVVATHF
jgi:hypothetical protein